MKRSEMVELWESESLTRHRVSYTLNFMKLLSSQTAQQTVTTVPRTGNKGVH